MEDSDESQCVVLLGKGRPVWDGLFFAMKEDYDSGSQYAARQGLEGAPHGGHDVSDLQAQTEGAQTAAVSTEEQETGSLAILPGITCGPGFLSLGVLPARRERHRTLQLSVAAVGEHHRHKVR